MNVVIVLPAVNSNQLYKKTKNMQAAKPEWRSVCGVCISHLGLRPPPAGWPTEAGASLSQGAEAGQLGSWTACLSPFLPHSFLWCWDPRACWAQGPVHGRLAWGGSPPSALALLGPLISSALPGKINL